MNTPKKRKRFTREQLRHDIFAVHDSASRWDAAKEFGNQPVYQRQHQSKWSRKLAFRNLRRPQEPSGRDMVCSFCGGGATDVMCRAVVSHCILALPFSCVGLNRFRIWQLYYISTCSDYFPSKNQIYLGGNFFKLKWTKLDLLSIHVNRIESRTGTGKL